MDVSKDWLAQLRRKDTKVVWKALGELFNVHKKLSDYLSSLFRLNFSKSWQKKLEVF